MGFSRQEHWSAISFSKRNYRKKESEVAQLSPTVCDPVDCSLPGSSIHGISQARVLEGVAMSFSMRSPYSTLILSIPPLQEPILLSIVPFGEGNGNPLLCSYLENHMDGGDWWATVYGVAKSQIQLSNSHNTREDSIHGHHQMVNT